MEEDITFQARISYLQRLQCIRMPKLIVMGENSKFNLMDLASHGRWDSYERFRSQRSGGIQGFGARARAPQQLPLNGQRLIPRQPGKWQKWQTGKTATMDAQGEGQISGNQTMDKRNRFEYEMR